MKLLAPTYQMYIQDYDEFLPPTKSLPHLVKLLKPYARNKDIFSCPATHTDYHANPEIGMIQLGAFKDRTIVPFYFDGKAHDDGQYVVAYLDGHVKAQSQAPVIPPAPKVKHHPAHRPS
jgi:prepilin-type processing-associated H-X9-DG protein